MILLILVFVIHCDGQTVTDDSNATSPSFAEIDFDNIWSREKLTGDWGGARTDLLNHGIDIGLRLTQYYQGVASGGRNTNFAYGGKFDIWLNLDGHKAGLWEDFFLHVRAENQFGESILSDAGSLALPNSTMLYPKATAGYRDMAVTQLLGKQFLSENFAVVFGKMYAMDLETPWETAYPVSDVGVNGFMNTNILHSAMPWMRWVNLSILGAGALVYTDDAKVQGGVLVIDLNNSTTTTGIPELFDDGAGFVGFWRLFFDVNEKPGSLMLGGGGSTREYHSFSRSSWGWRQEEPGIIEEQQELGNNKDDGVWSAMVTYRQVLWVKPTNEKQNLRFVTSWSVSDGDPSLGKLAGLASVEAMGLLFNREKDRAGFGGFYSQLGNDLKNRMEEIGTDLRDSWGVELYYNAEITPLLHVTPNIQLVQNQLDDDDMAVILGVRTVMDF